MPCNAQSESGKRLLVKRLESRLGPLVCNHAHRYDWHSSEDGSVEVFITYSKAHFEKRPWYDMTVKDIKELAAHRAGFIIFVLGHEDNFLVVPAKELRAQTQIHAATNGKYHFNLKGNVFEQLPDWNLKPYKENIELLPNMHCQK
jgi:hypothetical protein